MFENKLTQWALARRRRFAAVEELANEYRQSRATSGWVAGAHQLMAQSVLRKFPLGDGYYDYDFVAGAGHLLQIEKPAPCVRLVEEFLAERGIR